MACALAGGDFRANPYVNGEPEQYIQWIRGFRDSQTFDPNCAICHGTGKRKCGVTWIGSESPHSDSYDGVEIQCDCNIVSLEE
jgi:hypothetical protein